MRLVSLVFVVAVVGALARSAAARDDMSPPPAAITGIVRGMAHTPCRNACPVDTGSGTFTVTRLDLGGHRPAYLAEDTSNACGSAGCPLSILVKTGTHWTDVFDALGKPLVLTHETRGYHDLLAGFGRNEDGAQAYLFTWDGHQYVQAGTRPARGRAPAHLAY